MSRYTLAVAFVGAMTAVVACEAPAPLSTEPLLELARSPLSAQVPADGNGNKVVIPLSSTVQLSCGAVSLTRTIEGWLQVRLFDGASNRVELNVFHSTFTFTNPEGEIFVWRDAGPDRYWMEDGNLMIAITGRAVGHIGVLKINLATGEVVLDAGQDLGSPLSQACAALT